MKRRRFISQSTLVTASTIFASISSKLSAMPSPLNGVKRKIVLRSSWQTINIGDIGHTPGVLALCEKHLPNVEVILWASNVDHGVREMLLKRFPDLQIVLRSETEALEKVFQECDFLLHGSGPWLVASKDIDKWIKKTGKPFGVYGISLPTTYATDFVISLLNQAEFVFFRDSVSMELARSRNVKAPMMEFGPDGAFGVDLRDDESALTFMRENGLEDGKFLCVIPRYREVPEYKIPRKNKPFDAEREKYNESLKEHDHKPYRDAIIAVTRETEMKILICPEDMTQMELGKVALYDPLPDDVKKKTVWKSSFWLTDMALSTYVRSAGLFGLEQHSPIMCIGNGIPAFVGRFPSQTTKGFMWKDIGLGEWYFDSDSKFDMESLVPAVLWMAKNPDKAKEKALGAKCLVERRQEQTMEALKGLLFE